ncbi:MAG: capsule assembly Wzi family protein, partial [Psychrobacter pacificensis]|uniref:capsule assembly Wzi family protein n=1 Tax=Psychrobacter pacificensis TaxID=112002 RepID=UPI0023A6CE02
MSKQRKYKQLSVLIGLGMISMLASAQNLYMNDMKLKSELEWLNAQGVTHISTSTWPLTANEITKAITTAQVSTDAQQKVLQSVRATLAKNPNSLVKAEVDAYVQTDRQQLPQTFADDHLAGQEVSAALSLSEENWEMKLQANLKNDSLLEDSNDLSFEGSYIAGSAANQWLIAGQIPTWWGPGTDGSLIRGDASRPVVGITMQ